MTRLRTHVMVLAKSPAPGRVKTRLCPPCTPVQAADLATAALADTLEAVRACGADRFVLALDGAPGDWLPAGFEVLPQRGDGFDLRLTNAWADTGGAGVQIGMDTPQLSAGDLDQALDRLLRPRTDAVLGRAFDGGWWCIGLRRPHPSAFLGVPMSVAETGRHQRRRLDELGLRTAELPILRDVDTFDDALLVARAAPITRFADAVRQVVAA